MSASGSAPKTCANNGNVILEDARLDQLYCDFIVEKKKPSDEGEMAQRHKDHSSDDSQEQMKDSEAHIYRPKTDDKTGQSSLFFLAQQPNPFNPTKRPSIQHYPLQRDDPQ